MTPVAQRRRRASDREQPDLVRLSLALMGRTRTAEILDAALDVLAEQGDARWAILRAIGRDRFETRAHAGVGQADLVALGRAATGRDPWLVLDREVPCDGCGMIPDAAVYPDEGDGGEPALILGRWRGGPHRVPAPAARRQLTMAAELIACASGVARECEMLREQSARDMLTGMLNRRGVIDALDRELARAVRRGANVSVLYTDLDDFKAINDERGHAAGDEVLMRVGELLAHALRGSDAIGRLGGDEFLIVLPETEPDVAERIGRRLRRTLRGARIRLGSGEEVGVGLTYGIASLAERLDIAGLIDLADRRMLERKVRRRETDSGVPLSPHPAIEEARAATGRDAGRG